MSGIAAGGIITGALLAVFPVMVISSAADPVDQTCVNTAEGTVAASTSTAAELDATQLDHAATIIAVGRTRTVPDQGVVIALAAALQESRLNIYANDGLGGDLATDQHGIAASLGLPHDALGTDHGSLGIFQQQWPWWGSMHDLMDPATSAGLFYDALTQVPNWAQLPVTVAAQRVQRSAYPDAYADAEPLARRLLADLGNGIIGISTNCTSLQGSGTVFFPLPPGSGYVDQKNFGHIGSNWSAWHTGTDLSVACGTPVLAATSGTVQIETDQAWAGPWLVKVATRAGQLTTWYAHMNSVLVPEGTIVTGGQQIGTVGQLGNAHGCHLHFEVHPHGGTIYQDPVDPTAWLGVHSGAGLRSQ